MKMKLCLLVFLFMLIFTINVYSQPTIIYNTSASGLSLFQNTLTIEDGTILEKEEESGYGVYCDGDLNIILKGDATINADIGIKCDGTLTINKADDITSTPTLTINYTSIGLECDKKPFLINGVKIIINDVSLNPNQTISAYLGKPIENSLYVKDDKDNIAYYNHTFKTLNAYENRDLETDNIPIKNLFIEESKLALLSSINDTVTKLTRNSQSYTANQGFIIAIDDATSKVSYDSDINTHYVDIWNNFDEDNLSYNFIEFLFNKEEWGKTLKFKVIEAKNFYKDALKQEPFIKDEIYYYSIIGNSVYKDDKGEYLISNHLLFVADGDDNKIVLQLIGADEPEILKYVNLTVKNKDTINENKHEDKHEDKHEYTFVNTGVRDNYQNLRY